MGNARLPILALSVAEETDELITPNEIFKWKLSTLTFFRPSYPPMLEGGKKKNHDKW